MCVFNPFSSPSKEFVVFSFVFQVFLSLFSFCSDEIVYLTPSRFDTIVHDPSKNVFVFFCVPVRLLLQPVSLTSVHCCLFFYQSLASCDK